MKKISDWNKWDLHLHTKASNVMKDNDYSIGGVAFTDSEISSFVSKVYLDSKVSLAAITDHNYFDKNQFNKIKNEVRKVGIDNKLNINILAGVELDVIFRLDEKGDVVINQKDYNIPGNLDSNIVHVIIIINSDEKSMISSFHDVITKMYSTNKPQYLAHVVDDLIEKKVEFVLLPHFSKSHRNLESAVKDKPNGQKSTRNMEKKTEWILSGYFPILDGSKRDFINDRLNETWSFISDKLNYSIPIILTSDNHDYRTYLEGDEKISSYKSLPTFKGLKMCLSDYSQRININPLPMKSNYISRIVITDTSKKQNIVKTGEIQLSDDLNCIIGGRSSGKSLLLKKIIQVLDDQKVNKELSKYGNYNKNIEIELYDSNGKLYTGKPDYYEQGSIITRFRNSSDGGTLKKDFSDYFPSNPKFALVEEGKKNILELCLLLNENQKKKSSIKKVLLGKNINAYLEIPKVNSGFEISNNKAKGKIDFAKELDVNLRNYLITLDDIRSKLEPFSDLIKKHDDLSADVRKKHKQVLHKLGVLQVIYNSSQTLIQKNNTEKSNTIKRVRDIKTGISNITSRIVEYTMLREKCELTPEKIKEKIDSIEKNHRESEKVGKHRFDVRMSNSLKITDLLETFQDFHKNNEVKASKNFKNFISKVDNKGYKINTSKDLSAMISTVLDDKIKVEYLIYEGKELINNMSEGRKASVFLNLLLNKPGNIEPLIIDQPEDDMDNHDIYNLLVNTLREVKSNRQIIIATHDANVVVNGDAENVIYANKGIDKRTSLLIEYKNGGLEYDMSDINIQDTVCNVLEGGKKAFSIRADKYGINKLKLHRWEN